MVTTRALRDRRRWAPRVAPPLLAAAVLTIMLATTHLGAPARAIAIASIVASFVTAALVRRADMRSRGSAVLAIAGVTAAGQGHGGLAYGAASVVFALGVIASLRAARAGESRGHEAKREWRSPIVVAVVATAVAALLATQLPKLGGMLEQRIASMVGGSADGEMSGIASSMPLGSTTRMLMSDAVVMRVEGEPVEYLRGAIYGRYQARIWTSSRDERRQSVAADADRETSATRIVLARGAPLARGAEARWFLPRGACELGTPSGRVTVDDSGIVHPDPPHEPEAIWFRTGCTAPLSAVAGPGKHDLEIGSGLGAALAPIAAAWTQGAANDIQKLAAIQRRLGTFEYSLEVTRDEHLDPIVDFLTVHRAGHCELFASAMVLLARTQGIPARVVTGYHASEVNPLTGHMVVRERNAHAWVEAWIDGGWRPWDPTPSIESLHAQAGTLDHLLDVGSFAIDRVVVALGRLGLSGFGLLLGTLLGLLAGVRFAARLVGDHVRGRRSGDPRPLPCFDSLLSVLARKGLKRSASEPIERFARRVGSLPAPWAAEAASALAAYSELRYGDVGDERAVVRRMEDAARLVDPR